MISKNTPIVICGAGAIGCYLGAQWAAAGAPVVLLGRSALKRLETSGLNLSNGVSLSPQDLTTNPIIETEPAVLARAGLIVLSVKSTALPRVIDLINTHGAPQTPILCLLNGLAPIRSLKTAFPKREIAAGMVPYNVVWQDAETLRRSSVGDVIVERTPTTQALLGQIPDVAEPIRISDHIKPVQYGKLLLNLNNPVNALSGKSLYHQLKERPYRQVYAAALQEALRVYKGASIQHAQSGPLPAHRIVHMLRAPNWLFNTIALRLQKLDPSSQTSMAQDLASGKPTEIDTLNGEIVKLAESSGQTAPVNARLVALVKAAEAGGPKTYSAQSLLKATLN